MLGKLFLSNLNFACFSQIQMVNGHNVYLWLFNQFIVSNGDVASLYVPLVVYVRFVLLAFVLPFSSLCRLAMIFFQSTGRVPRIIRLNIRSEGGTPVEVWGVARYCRKIGWAVVSMADSWVSIMKNK